MATKPRKIKKDKNKDAAPVADVADAITPEEQAKIDAAAAAMEEKREVFGQRVGDLVEDITEKDKASAIEVRAKWAELGSVLVEGEQLFISENTNKVNDKAYGQWLKTHGLTKLIGNRPTRAAAKWLAQVNDMKPELWNLFPTDPDGDEPVRRSPRTLQGWVRGRIVSCFDRALDALDGNDGDDAFLPHDGTKGKDGEDAAKAMLPNVSDVVDAQIALATTAVEIADKAHANASDKKAADTAENLRIKNRELRDVKLDKAVWEQHSIDELVALYLSWKPKVKAEKFADKSVADCVRWLAETYIGKHEEAAAIVAGLTEWMDGVAAAVDTDGGDVDDDEDLDGADDGADEDEDDFDDFDDFEDDEDDEDAA